MGLKAIKSIQLCQITEKQPMRTRSLSQQTFHGKFFAVMLLMFSLHITTLPAPPPRLFASGDLFFSGFFNGPYVRWYDSAGNFIMTLTGDPRSETRGATFDAAGNLY